MVPWLVVIDDFLDQPDLVRARALQLTYAVPGHFPGLNSTEKIPVRGLAEVVSNLVREPLHTPWAPEFSHQNCRLSLASDSAPGRVHIDPTDWTGVLSLSRNEDAQGGTEFLRHRRTGTDHVPTTPAEMAAAGYKSFAELDADILQKDALDPSKWEQTFSVPLRFNQLVLFQPYYWHTAGPGFGDSVENGRLVYLIFFKRLAPGAPPGPR